MGAIELNEKSYDKKSKQIAIEEYIAKYKVEPEENNPEVTKRAAEIFREKLYNLSVKYKKEQPKSIFDELKDEEEIHQDNTKQFEPQIPKMPNRGYEIPELGIQNEKPQAQTISGGYEIPDFEVPTIITKVQVPKKPIMKAEIPDFSSDKIKIEYEDLKKASVGEKKNKKNPVVVTLTTILSLMLIGSIGIGIAKINTKLNTKEGSIGTFPVSEFHGYKWYGDEYTTWYNFEQMGKKIIDNAYECDGYSNLDINDAIAMILGEESRHVVEDENYYGDPSKWYYSAAEYDGETKGWASRMYDSMKEEALAKGLELPNTLKEFLEQRGLDKYKYTFNSITGNTSVSLIDDLSVEEQQYYKTTGGMLENLTNESLTLQYKNGIKGVSK